MGWTYTHKDPSVPPKEFFADRFNYQYEDGRYGKIIAFALKNLRTAYAAYEVWSPELGKEVIGLVILVNYAPRDFYNFGFKEMEESMGPFESECPEKILKLLTPTDNEYANNWRNRCWENIRKSQSMKLTKGLRIRFEKPINFTNGDKVQEFIVLDAQKGIYADLNNPYRRYKIKRTLLRNAEIVSQPVICSGQDSLFA